MKRRSWVRLLKALGALAALGVGGFIVVLSGVVPVKASSGHWAITAWFLELAMERSISTHTLMADTLTFEEPWLVLKGAGHYETACRPCHGSPDLKRSVVVRAMTPAPPYLPPDIANWRPEELFYIVKHGVKFTGMPAWPTQQRDDEVRAMVAFLLALEKLDADKYRLLVFGETRTEDAALALRGVPELQRTSRSAGTSCARCHGSNGLGRGNAAFPKLAGQRREYLRGSLDAYARGARPSGVMQPLAFALSEEEKNALADYFSRMPGTSPSRLGAADPSSPRPEIGAGQEIATRGIPSQGIPSCRDCHGPGPERRNPIYPNLAGQYADYLVLQLELFKSGRRGGTPFSHIMNHVAARLAPDQMRAVALYYASLSQPPDDAAR